ncbi:MAG: hypothetical protein PHW66_01575 [Gallionella sp.]|nr:hypothetical protein [Gallionella sp.]
MVAPKEISDLFPVKMSLFTPQSLNPDGGITMLAHEPENRRVLYLTNQYGQKLLKIVVKSETQKFLDTKHAQIKIITYGIKRAWVWRDQPSDPQIAILRDGVNLTYHGGQKNGQNPKVHIKATTGYINLIDDSLQLPSDTYHPVPLFSLETGYANQWALTNPVTKSGHIISTGDCQSVRFDLYLVGSEMDLGAFFNSMYFLTLVGTHDYLVAAKNCPLTSGLIIAPITFCHMGNYQVLIRRSVSNQNGRPRLHFYNNKNYYAKLMNRPTATKNDDGTLNWSTMAQEDERLLAEYRAQSFRAN